MNTPPSDGAQSSEPVSFDKPAADPAAQPVDEPPFDPYRFGAPEYPVPPEYAPPGYVPPPVPQPPAGQQSQYPPYAGGPPPGQHPGQYPGQPGYQGYPGYPGQPHYAPPPWTQYPQPRAGSGRAIAALVLGIISILFFWTSILDIVPVVLAIVFGSIGINDAKRGASGRSMAVSGIVCGIVGALLAVTFTVVVYARIKPCLDNYDQGSAAQNTCVRHKF
ncbi:MAG: hypothetical protein QOG80_3241 [Pseudonocardiales bacterium]|nr:hypothetical protein [Pseudonocardiales bacterium]